FPLQADAFRGHGLSLRVLRTTGSQGSWDCTVVRPTEEHLLFPQMFSVGRVIADPGVAAFRSKQRCSASDYEEVRTFMEVIKSKKDAVNDNLSQTLIRPDVEGQNPSTKSVVYFLR